MQKVNISEKLSLFSDHWNPRVVGRLNGQHVRLAKFQGELVWHQHDDEDELFLVIRGSFEMPPPDLLINNAGVINRNASELLGRVRGCKPLTRGVGEKRDGFPAFSQYRAQRRITFGIK